jgi:hypothetical protein
MINARFPLLKRFLGFRTFRVICTLSALCLLICGFAVLVTGCAYHVGSGDRQVPGGYRAIAVPVFKNLSQEVGIEVYFTNAMIRELERSSIGRVSDKNDAQVTLEGAITSVTYVAGAPVSDALLGSLPQNTILNGEYRILLVGTVTLRRNSDQKILWEGGFNGERSYLTPRIGLPGLTGANALYNTSARYQNIEEMASDLMAETYDRLTENF